MMNKLPPLGNQIVGRTSEGRPIILNPDGSYSTERTATVEHPMINGGKPTNIPTIFRGREFDPDTAAEIIAQYSQMRKSIRPIDPETGQPLQAFGSIDEAEAHAKERSKAIDLMISKAFDPEALQTPKGFDALGLGLGTPAFFKP